MALMLRSELSASVLPAVAPTAAEALLGRQPGSNQQLAMYSIASCVDTESTERIEFKFAGGTTLTYARADYQYLIDVNGNEYFYGSVCVEMHPLRKTGAFPDWAFAMSPSSGVILPAGYK